MKNYQTDHNMKLPVNVKDIPGMEAEIRAVEGEPGQQELLQRYTGPDVGLEYDDETDRLLIADGWHADENGFVVKA